MLELLALGIVAVIAWGVSQGLKEHMEPEPGLKGPGTVPAPLPPLPPPVTLTCEEWFAKLPTGSSDIDNLQKAVIKMYKVASTVEDAKVLEDTAAGLDAIGASEASACLRARAAEIRAGAGTSALFPTDTTLASETTAPATSVVLPGSSPTASSTITAGIFPG